MSHHYQFVNVGGLVERANWIMGECVSCETVEGLLCNCLSVGIMPEFFKIACWSIFD